jgi:hypothetical protein
VVAAEPNRIKQPRHRHHAAAGLGPVNLYFTTLIFTPSFSPCQGCSAWIGPCDAVPPDRPMDGAGNRQFDVRHRDSLAVASERRASSYQQPVLLKGGAAPERLRRHPLLTNGESPAGCPIAPVMAIDTGNSHICDRPIEGVSESGKRLLTVRTYEPVIAPPD